MSLKRSEKPVAKITEVTPASASESESRGARSHSGMGTSGSISRGPRSRNSGSS